MLVPYDKEVFDALRNEIFPGGNSRPESLHGWMRRAALYSVSIFRPANDNPIVPHLLPVPMGPPTMELSDTQWAIALPDVDYDPLLGLVTPNDKILIG